MARATLNTGRTLDHLDVGDIRLNLRDGFAIVQLDYKFSDGERSRIEEIFVPDLVAFFDAIKDSVPGESGTVRDRATFRALTYLVAEGILPDVAVSAE